MQVHRSCDQANPEHEYEHPQSHEGEQFHPSPGVLSQPVAGKAQTHQRHEAKRQRQAATRDEAESAENNFSDPSHRNR